MPTVTSENKAEFDQEFLAKKGLLTPERSRVKSMEDEQFERVKKHPKFAKLKVALGKKGAIEAILKELNESQ